MRNHSSRALERDPTAGCVIFPGSKAPENFKPPGSAPILFLASPLASLHLAPFILSRANKVKERESESEREGERGGGSENAGR